MADRDRESRLLIPSDRSARPPLSLYLHLPFCERKCGYCDFNSVAGMDDRIPAYVAAIEAEVREYAGRLAGPTGPAALSTVFLGGGTPTRVPVALLARLLDTVRSAFRLLPGAEVTCEANPGSSETGKFRALREAGVTRISVGVQSLDDAELRTLDRVHSAAEAEAALEAVRAAGFESWNADLIFAVPGQTRESWRRTLDRVLAHEPPHVSAYSLTYEEGTPFYTARREGRLLPVDEGVDLRMFETTRERLEAAGLPAYEISNFARPGFECRHNLAYWDGGEYVGCGAGAHGFVGGERWMNVKPIDGYVAKVRAGTRPLLQSERPTEPQRMFERMFCGLRRRTGVDRESFRTRFGRPIEEIFGPSVDRCRREGWVEFTPTHLRLTAAGLRFADQVFVEFALPDHP